MRTHLRPRGEALIVACLPALPGAQVWKVAADEIPQRLALVGGKIYLSPEGKPILDGGRTETGT